jgi:toxin FitB
MFLLDTAVVLELRRAKAGRADPALTAWAAGAAPLSLFVSVLALVELENAAARLAHDDKAVGAALRSWIGEQVLPAFDGRVLALDAAVAQRRAALPIAEPRDALLAATALEHGLTLATRDPAAFRGARVKLVNPWRYQAGEDEADLDWGQAARAGQSWLKTLFVRG